GARVHFDVLRDDGVLRAENVVLRHGTRVSPRQTGFGDLSGAREPAATGGAASSRRNPAPVVSYDHHPARAVEDWAGMLAARRRVVAFSYCAPVSVLLVGCVVLSGIVAFRRWWDASPQLGAGFAPTVARVGPDTFELTWAEPSPNRIRVRVAHGLVS